MQSSHILTETNHAFSMSSPPPEATDLRYCVLDYSDPAEPDFHFPPLIFIDSFIRPVAHLTIGKHSIQMPLDWSIVIADKNLGEVEVVELSQIGDRSFSIFGFNPLTSSSPSFEQITVARTSSEQSWFMPKLRNGHLLAVPLSDGENPPCAYFVKDVNKVPEALDITKIF